MPDSLVDDWIRYHAEKREGTDALLGAWEKVDEIVHRDEKQDGFWFWLSLTRLRTIGCCAMLRLARWKICL
jgi:hypothetical protein